ncbi:hypothetical protein [Bacillus phage YungSlug]|nr:hypothetical protein [Bacillus phage YungSlug]
MTNFLNLKEGSRIRVNFFRKIGDIEELTELAENLTDERLMHGEVKDVEKIVTLTNEEFNKLTSEFLVDNDLYAHFSATNRNADGVLVLSNGGDELVVVDPQGYDYARYVGFIGCVEEE